MFMQVACENGKQQCCDQTWEMVREWICVDVRIWMSLCAFFDRYVHRNRNTYLFIYMRLVCVERAYTCGVCKTLYSISPWSHTRWRVCQWHALRGLAAFVCLLFLVYGFVEPPWPHLALFAIILLGTRSQGIFAGVLLMVGIFLAALHLRGLKMFMQLHESKGMSISFMKPMPIGDLGPGTVLVASEKIKGSIFSQSIVLVYQYNASGSTGVILNQRMQSHSRHNCESTMVDCNTGHDDVHDEYPRHFFGGPVGLPGEGATQEITVLHGLTTVRDSREIQLASMDQKLYYGGKIGDVLEEANKTTYEQESVPVLIFHGISTWSSGQLEREISAGAWGYKKATYEDILDFTHSNNDKMWKTLCGEVKWL